MAIMRVYVSAVLKQLSRKRRKKVAGGYSVSKDISEFERYLSAVAILHGCAEGAIDLSYLDGPEGPHGYAGVRDDVVFVAIVHDSSGYTPGGAIVVLQNEGSPDEALQEAMELLENNYREDKEHMDDVAQDVKEHFMKEHGLSEQEFQAMINSEYPSEYDELRDDYWTQVDEWAFEAFDGQVWTLNAKEAAEVISKSQVANEITITWPSQGPAQ